jgi:hypothetical protein
MVGQDVNRRAEWDLSSPLSRFHLLNVPIEQSITHTTRYCRQNEVDGSRRRTNPAETGRRNEEGSSISETDQDL